MNIILTGPQGSGKGTQAALIAKEYRMVHLSTGELLREEIAKGTALGKEVAGIINEGNLVPDEMSNSLVQMKMVNYNNNHIILDGYPRTKNQAEFVKKIIPVEMVLNIHISDEAAIKRISARRGCPKCHTDYNLLYVKPKKTNTCDKCNTKLVQRADDYPAAIKKRLETYHNNEELLKKVFNKEGQYVTINGEQLIDRVFIDVKKVMDSRKKVINEVGPKDGFFNRLTRFFKS